MQPLRNIFLVRTLIASKYLCKTVIAYRPRPNSRFKIIFLQFILKQTTIAMLKSTASAVSLFRIVVVNSRFLQRPQKRSRGNQLIHIRLTKTKSIGRGSRSRESDRQTVWQAEAMVAMVDSAWSWDGEGVWGRWWIRIGFDQEQCFSLEWKNCEGLGQFLGWIRSGCDFPGGWEGSTHPFVLFDPVVEHYE